MIEEERMSTETEKDNSREKKEDVICCITHSIMYTVYSVMLDACVVLLVKYNVVVRCACHDASTFYDGVVKGIYSFKLQMSHET